MKKLVIFLILLLPIYAFAKDSFMDKCIKSWVGYPLEDVAKKWGYPNHEKDLSGKKLFVWETYDTKSNFYSGNAFVPYDKIGHETFLPMENITEVSYCRKILEVDANGIVTGGRYEGDDCPKFYTFGKQYVNPENDEWQDKKK